MSELTGDAVKQQPEFPCPVCPGVSLRKVVIAGPDPFMLDNCASCGGVWFDHGEVTKLKQCTPEDLWRQIAQTESVYRAECRNCGTPMDRNDKFCRSCYWENRIECPACNERMEAIVRAGVKLDVCRGCRGVWFDRHELAEIWRVEFNAAVGRTTVVMEGVGYDPFLTLYGAQAMATAAPGLVHAAGEATTHAFDRILATIGDVFRMPYRQQ